MFLRLPGWITATEEAFHEFRRSFSFRIRLLQSSRRSRQRRGASLPRPLPRHSLSFLTCCGKPALPTLPVVHAVWPTAAFLGRTRPRSTGMPPCPDLVLPPPARSALKRKVRHQQMDWGWPTPARWCRTRTQWSAAGFHAAAHPHCAGRHCSSLLPDLPALSTESIPESRLYLLHHRSQPHGRH